MHNLLSGNSKSCGCLKVHVFQPGQRFGRLVVTGRHGKSKLRNDKKGYEWLWACRCDCGNTYVAKANQLFKGKVLSCGCLREFRCGSFLPEGVAAANHLFWKYKKWAKTKKRSFTISKKRAFELFVGNCHYCGVAPYRKHAYSNCGNGTFTFNGIDRVDNSKGYDEGNLVSCCTPCNHAKLNRPVDDFLEWVRRVAQHQGMINV